MSFDDAFTVWGVAVFGFVGLMMLWSWCNRSTEEGKRFWHSVHSGYIRSESDRLYDLKKEVRQELRRERMAEDYKKLLELKERNHPSDIDRHPPT